MAVETFTFAIALPPGPDSLALFEELSSQMARYIGLDDARGAGAALIQLVAERLQGDAPVEVTFTRPIPDAPVTVEVSGPPRPGDKALAESVGATVTAADDPARGWVRLSWTVAGE